MASFCGNCSPRRSSSEDACRVAIKRLVHAGTSLDLCPADSWLPAAAARTLLLYMLNRPTVTPPAGKTDSRRELLRPRPAVSRSAVLYGGARPCLIGFRSPIGRPGCGRNMQPRSSTIRTPSWPTWRAGVLQHLRDDARLPRVPRVCRNLPGTERARFATPWAAKRACGRPSSAICSWRCCWMPR